MAVARRFHPQPLLQRLRRPERPEDATVEGKLDLMLQIEEGYDQEFDWTYRNFQWDKKPDPQPVFVGGSTSRIPRRLVPVCHLIAEMEEIHPAMTAITWPVWNRVRQRQLEGVIQDAEISRVVGTVWLESRNGGVPTQYLVDLLPLTERLYAPGGSVLGFEVGFGRFNEERLNFLLDVHVYEPEATTALTEMVPDRSARFVTADDVLTEALLTDYTDGTGLRFKCNITLAG